MLTSWSLLSWLFGRAGPPKIPRLAADPDTAMPPDNEFPVAYQTIIEIETIPINKTEFRCYCDIGYMGAFEQYRHQKYGCSGGWR